MQNEVWQDRPSQGVSNIRNDFHQTKSSPTHFSVPLLSLATSSSLLDESESLSFFLCATASAAAFLDRSSGDLDLERDRDLALPRRRSRRRGEELRDLERDLRRRRRPPSLLRERERRAGAQPRQAVRVVDTGPEVGGVLAGSQLAVCGALDSIGIQCRGLTLSPLREGSLTRN